MCDHPTPTTFPWEDRLWDDVTGADEKKAWVDQGLDFVGFPICGSVEKFQGFREV